MDSALVDPAWPPMKHVDAGPSRTRDPLRIVGVDDDASHIAASLEDPERFSEIFERHWPTIYRYCAGRSGEDGDDIAAEVFSIAFAKRHSFEPTRSTALPWLYGIASNLLRRRYRTAARRGRAIERLRFRTTWVPDLDQSVAGRLDADADAQATLAALDTLRAEDREILLLYVWADLGYAEIAEALDIPIGTVRSRLSRTRRKLAATAGVEMDR